MTDPSPAAPSWGDYYRAVARRPPRELLRQTVMRWEAATAGERLAVDLGCGGGIETADLLARGWNVMAIDKEPEAIAQLSARVPAEQREQLRTEAATFEDLALPPADFIWAGLSLPFCAPEHFAGVWAKIRAALKPGGRFAGDFFGDRCGRGGWLSGDEMTFVTREQVLGMVTPLHLEYFIEEEGERPTALAGMQHFHGFSLIVRR